MEGDNKATGDGQTESAVGILKHLATPHSFMHSFPIRLFSSPFRSMRMGHAAKERTSRSRGLGFASRKSGCDPSSSSNGGVSERIGRLMQVRCEYASATEFEIDASKAHWSELDPSSEGSVETDAEVFARLREKCRRFFRYPDSTLVVGEKIAEGAQAEIFSVSGLSPGDEEYVLKVFKEGYRLRDLEKQWPRSMFEDRVPALSSGSVRYETIWELCFLSRFLSRETNLCYIPAGMLLPNGRFAFLMMRQWGDLRKLIDIRMQHNQNRGPPFTDLEVKSILTGIAKGMEELHRHYTAHRDLKASNVLISFRFFKPGKPSFDPLQDVIDCKVADFESSVGTVGTGYWRAPEILRALQEGVKSVEFTGEADVYSFAMTCYEVLTGRTPFENLPGGDYWRVIEGQRPQLPAHVHPLWETFLKDCWHENPSQRPSFEEIRVYLEKIYSQGEALARILGSWERCNFQDNKKSRRHDFSRQRNCVNLLPHASDLVPALLATSSVRHWEGKEVAIGILDDLCNDWYSAKAEKVDFGQMEHFRLLMVPPCPLARQIRPVARRIRPPPRTTPSRFKPLYNDEGQIINKPKLRRGLLALFG